MAIKYIIPGAPREVDIDGTIVTVKTLTWREREDLQVALSDANRGADARRVLSTMLDTIAPYVVGFSDCPDSPAREVLDIIEDAAILHRITNAVLGLEDREAKNLPSSQGQSSGGTTKDSAPDTMTTSDDCASSTPIPSYVESQQDSPSPSTEETGQG